MALGLMVLSGAAIAKPPFLQTFKTTYNIKEGSKLDKAGCGICHAGAPPKLNPYGKDVQKQMKADGAEAVTEDTLKKIEKLDSDKDKATNIAEIKADTLPGDPASKPAATKKATPPKKKKH